MHASSIPWPRRLAVLAVIIAAALGLAACGHSSGSAKADASSIAANATVSADLNQAEQLLVTNVQKNFQPAHPVKSMEAAIRATFPQGDAKAIAAYALSIFNPAVLTTSGPGSARDAWAEHVFDFAKQQGGYTPPASASTAPATAGTSP